MPSTYEPIATQTLGSATNNITFSSIPSTYTDLILVANIGVSVATANTFIRFNSDSGSNYSVTQLRGNGSSATSHRLSNQTRINTDYDGFSTSLGSNIIIQVQNYSNSTTNKTTLIRTNEAAYSTVATVGLWRNTAAITSIFFSVDTHNFITGSSFTLYGIKAA
jgi:hypothetical protein